MRINKFLATCGVASRRKCDELILQGKVLVNKKKVTQLGLDVDEEKDEVVFNGEIVTLPETRVYYMLHKPKGYVTSASDDRGRKTVLDLVKSSARIFPVGRLDYDSEGLVLLTNDGELANMLTHPSFEIEKTYVAKIEGKILESELAVLRAGVVIDGKRTAKAKFKLLDFDGKISRIEVKIKEGRNRQVRKMFEAIGHEVIFLKRTAIGGLKLGGLSRGEFRELKPEEVVYLQNI